MGMVLEREGSQEYSENLISIIIFLKWILAIAPVLLVQKRKQVLEIMQSPDSRGHLPGEVLE